MGKISKDERCQILNNCSVKLKTYLNKLSMLSEDSLIVLIIILGQYLFARYSIYGKFDGITYTVYTNTITDNLCDDRFINMASAIIRLRNLIAHNYGSDSMVLDMSKIKDNIEDLNEFLKYLLEDSSDIASGFLNACDM